MGPQPENPTRWNRRTLYKYSLFQIPGVILIIIGLALFDYWIDLPGWIWALTLGVWVAKDALMFPFLWRSFDDRYQAHTYLPLNQTATVVERIDPVGRVRFRNELWGAELAEGVEPIELDITVRVVEAKGLLLVVAPEPDDETP